MGYGSPLNRHEGNAARARRGEFPFAHGPGGTHARRLSIMSDIPTEISHDQHAVRRQKLADLRAAGQDPFRANCEQTHFSAEALKLYVDGQDNAVTVSVAGRLVTIRDMGKSQFVKILDQEGLIQLYVRKDVIGDDAYAAFKKLDIGDFIGITGRDSDGHIDVVQFRDLHRPDSRPLGPQHWGPWLVQADPGEAVTFMAVHRCHALWPHYEMLGGFVADGEKK